MPCKEVYTKWEIAFLESLAQQGQLVGVFRLGECDKIEVGVLPGVAPNPGAVRPYFDTRQMGLQQIANEVQVRGG